MINNRQLPNRSLIEVAKQYKRVKHALPHIEEEIGFLLYDYIIAKGVKNILEIGTCLGYSTIFMASALKENKGKVLTIEKNEDLFWKAKENIFNSGLSVYVDMLCADACEVLPNLTHKYDLIFQDSQKSLYVEMLDNTINLLNKEGVIIADDTLLYLTNPYKNVKRSIYDYNSKVFANPNLESTIIPLGDGITMSVRKEI
ncbi:MAG: O-methyltransferase [Clostridia bacterium]